MVAEKMNAVDLFAGAGGLGLGLERAGFQVVLANEIEPDFASSYARNHPKTRVLTDDIQHIDFEREISLIGSPKITLLAGGPPCQGFSTVGSKNEKDPRNHLFREFLRAAESLSPDYLLFENVSGFKSLYGGSAYTTLIHSLDALGFCTTSSVLCASDFGLPQFRKRTIVLAWKKHLPSVLLPTPTHAPNENLFGLPKKLCLWDAISDLPPISAGESAFQYKTEPQTSYQKNLRENTKDLTEHNVANYGEKMKTVLEKIPPGGSIDDLPEELRPKSYFKNTYARLLHDQPTPTITRNFGTPSSSRCVHPFQNRALSTREGARIQGFPDSYQFTGNKISKNLQIGNAVPPLFGEVIARQILTS